MGREHYSESKLTHYNFVISRENDKSIDLAVAAV